MKALVVVAFLSWYVATGWIVDSYADSIVRRQCAGHVLGPDRYPWFKLFGALLWPVNVPVVITMPYITLECGRFDP